jgi:hypothetical protein
MKCPVKTKPIWSQKNPEVDEVDVTQVYKFEERRVDEGERIVTGLKCRRRKVDQI